jgi:hypothetical protein
MKSAIYLIRSAGKTKIGYSKNPWKRYRQLCTGCPSPAALVLTLYCHEAPALERALHKEFKDRRDQGEWFSVEIHEILRAISVLVSPTTSGKCKFIELNKKPEKPVINKGDIIKPEDMAEAMDDLFSIFDDQQDNQ